MKALVTGATGFVGGHLVERLLDAGHAVACLVRETSDTSALQSLGVELRTVSLDAAGPAADGKLAEAVGGFDCVIHCAGLTRGRSLAEYLAVNEAGTRRLLEAVLAGGAPPKRFIYVSSLAAAGPAKADPPPDESVEPCPADDYGKSKLAGERATMELADHMDVTIVRPPAVYGPRDKNFLPLLRSALRLGRVPIVGRPTDRVAMVYVTDLAEGICLAAETPAAVGRTYYIASEICTRTEMVQAVCRALNIAPRSLRLPSILARIAGEIGQLKWAITGRPQLVSRRKVRDMLQPRWTCDWSRARKELGYREAVTLVEGMRRTAEWYFENGWLEKKGRAR